MERRWFDWGGVVGDSTLADLKRAVDAGVGPQWYPVGSEIMSEWNNSDAPLIVAHYLDGTTDLYTDMNGNNAVGVLCVRKEPAPIPHPIDATNSHTYPTSPVNDYLQNEYFESCDEDTQNIISPINVRYVEKIAPDAPTNVVSKFFLMAGIEVMGKVYSNEGLTWDLWKDRTGLIETSNKKNTGRVITDAAGETVSYWLRSQDGDTSTWYVSENGSVYTDTNDTSLSILPACFISKTPSA